MTDGIPQAGAPAAFGAALVALLPRLRRYALVLAPAPDRADDLVQGACERALAARERFVPGTRLDAWVLRILHNLWIDGLRRERTAGPSDAAEAADTLVGADGERDALARLALGEVGAAIGRLGDDQRAVLVLVCIEGLSYAEAASVLDVPVGTVMSRLARARLRLAEDTGIGAPPARSSGKEGRR